MVRKHLGVHGDDDGRVIETLIEGKGDLAGFDELNG